MDVLEAIRRRRSVRAYSNQPISREVMDRMRQALRSAPSACNYQPWHFVIVSDEELRREIAKAANGQSWMAAAPITVVACGLPGRAYKGMGGHGNSADIDVAIALDHLTLAAVGDGLGTLRNRERRPSMDRRDFLQAAAVAGLSTRVARGAIRSPNDRISVCVMGLRGRGGSLLSTFASLPEVDVTYVCDIDERVLQSQAEKLADKTGRRPQRIKDYRKALDDKMVDALVIGTPDHWHALPTIHACQAGKDVYVEKPDSHNIMEGRTMVAAVRKYGRVVQLGTQGRSGEMQCSAMEYIAAGHLGKVRFAKAWESSRQGNIGHPPNSDPPPGVDYDMWLGPAPKRPFNIRRFHGSWRWFFDYGTGDLGNDGVHLLDFARWGLETAVAAEGKDISSIPRAVSSHGGKYYFDDAQEWPARSA